MPRGLLHITQHFHINFYLSKTNKVHGVGLKILVLGKQLGLNIRYENIGFFDIQEFKYQIRYPKNLNIKSKIPIHNPIIKTEYLKSFNFGSNSIVSPKRINIFL